MSGPQIVKAASLRDVVAVVPFECGFHPRHSLVVLSLRGRRLGVGQVARADLPTPEDAAELVADLVASVVRDQASASIVVVYDDQPWDSQAPPHLDLVTALRAALDGARAPAREAVYVTPERYWSYLCRTLGCCPSEGGSVAAAMTSPVAAALVLAGVAPLPTREHLRARLRPSGPLVVAAVADSAWRCLAAFAGEVDRSGPQAEERLAAPTPDRRRLAAEATTLLDRLLPGYRAGAPTMTHDEAGQLVAYLQIVPVRDELLVRYCRVGVPLPAGAGLSGAGHGRDALPGLGAQAPPDPTLEEPMGHLLVDLCARIEGPLAAAPLSLLAWHSWARGEGALARIAVDRALAEDPSYRLAALLTAALAHGLAPDWVVDARITDTAAS